jgi:hypothetical protein
MAVASVFAWIGGRGRVPCDCLTEEGCFIAQPWVTGPAALWAGVGNAAGAPALVGYSERGFTIDTQMAYIDFINDMGGPVTPLDLQDGGEQAFISGTLNWWNENVMAAMSLLKNCGNPTGAPLSTVWGTRQFGTIGAFQGFEKRAMVLWLVYPYSAKPYFQNTTTGPMEVGRRYPFAMLKQNQESTGTRAKQRIVSWHCLPSFNPTNQVGVLWDYNMTAIPSGVAA